MPKVFNKLGGEDVPGSAIYVGRGSLYGNPFQIGVHGTRKQVIKRFCEEVLPSLDVSELRGKDLVCFCSPKPCHADHILAKANSLFI